MLEFLFFSFSQLFDNVVSAIMMIIEEANEEKKEEKTQKDLK
jgi:hypothetical protein